MTELAGGCHCGAIRYTVTFDEEPRSGLCHCRDCCKSAGAPGVGWALVGQDAIAITGTPASYQSSENATRQFCATCGTGLFYYNETIFPGQVDFQTATLDDVDALPPGARVQVAEAPKWMEHFAELPALQRYT